MNFSHSSYLSVLGLSALLCLSACKNEKQEETAAPQLAVDQKAEEAQAAIENSRSELFNEMVYNMGSVVSSYSSTPELNEAVREMLGKLQNYYDALVASGKESEERAAIALRIADTTKELGAFAKAEDAYKRAQEELNKQPQQEKESPEGRRMQSSIHNGMGVCLLNRNQATEALGYYEKALAEDNAMAEELLPKDIAAMKAEDITQEVSRGVCDLMSSYRCLGDCQQAANDPEEARSTYRKGIAIAEKFKQTTPEMSISFARIISSLGNIESATMNEDKALHCWVRAAQIYSQVYQSPVNASLKNQAKRYFDGLVPSIKSVSEKLKNSKQDEEQAGNSTENAQ